MPKSAQKRILVILFFTSVTLFSFMLYSSPGYSAPQLQPQDLTPWAYLPYIRKDLMPAVIKITNVYVPSVLPANGEYVQIENQGGTAQEMTNWKLRDQEGETCTLAAPPNPPFTLQPGASVRVYGRFGNDNATELFCDRSSPWSMWDREGDTAYLYDQGDNLIDTYSY